MGYFWMTGEYRTWRDGITGLVRNLHSDFLWRIWAGILYGGFVWLFKVSKICMVVLGE